MTLEEIRVAPIHSDTAYILCLLRMHELDPKGEIGGHELDGLSEALGDYYDTMTGHGVAVANRFSKDLYAIADAKTV